MVTVSGTYPSVYCPEGCDIKACTAIEFTVVEVGLAFQVALTNRTLLVTATAEITALMMVDFTITVKVTGLTGFHFCNYKCINLFERK